MSDNPAPDTATSPSAAPSVTSRLIKVGRTVLLILVLAGAVWALVRNWSDVKGTLADLSWPQSIPSFVMVPVAMACATLSWQVFVDALGPRVGVRRGAQIFLVGQLGKYLPGSVWAYVLQVELGRKAGLARARVFAATVFSLATAVVAALIGGVVAIPTLVQQDPSLAPLRWLYLILPVVLVCLHPKILTAAANAGFKILRRPQPDRPIKKRTVLHSLFWAMLSYAAFGLHLWFLVPPLPGPSSGLFLCIGAMSIGMIAGLFFFLLPSGAGVRELIIVTALTPSVGVGPAVAFAAVSRVFLTAADLLMAGGAALLALLERRSHGRYSGDPGITSDED